MDTKVNAILELVRSFINPGLQKQVCTDELIRDLKILIFLEAMGFEISSVTYENGRITARDLKKRSDATTIKEELMRVDGDVIKLLKMDGVMSDIEDALRGSKYIMKGLGGMNRRGIETEIYDNGEGKLTLKNNRNREN